MGSPKTRSLAEIRGALEREKVLANASRENDTGSHGKTFLVDRLTPLFWRLRHLRTVI